MCGIAGCVMPAGGRPDAAALERMAAALSHRGPDHSGLRVLGSVGLVNTRLAVVDPGEAGHQPMCDGGGRWWLTYNGEVFNHAELRARLEPVAWRGGSDTETLVEALARWGHAAIERCNGLFAYAALDTHSRRLLLVRDRFGVKPLYLARHGDALFFASELRALLEAGLPRRARADIMRHSLAKGWAGGAATPVEGVWRLAPGTTAEVDLESLATRTRRWYQPGQEVDRERMGWLARAGRQGALGEVESALRRSVRRRCMADVPLATMCSGGIDSGLVTAFVREHIGGVPAFHVSVADQPAYDEATWALRTAEHLGVHLHTVRMDAAAWRAGLVGAVRHLEYPLTHESSVPMAMLARLARSRGVKVLLSGEGADELFGGYDWLAQHELADFRGRRHPGSLARHALSRWLRGRGLLARPAVGPSVGPAPEPNRFEREVWAAARAAYGHHRGPRRRLEAALLAALSTYLPHLLNRQDKMTMQEGVETRVPYLDPEVVALALNLPLELRVEPRRKALLRELAGRHLPRGVAARAKVGFGFEAFDYLDGATRPEFLERGLLREVLEEPRERWAQQAMRARGYPAVLLWSAEVWCRVVLAGDAVDSVEEQLWRDRSVLGRHGTGAPLRGAQAGALDGLVP